MAASRLWYGLGLALIAGMVVVSHADAQQQPADSSGPQTVVPAPLTSATPDVPGGSSHDGVIRPPPTADTKTVVHPALPGIMPVIPSPGTQDNAPLIQPK
jgi:hypothetical protein